MDIDTYLARIGFDSPVRPEVDSLFGLHRSHLLSVPFENLDILTNTPIQLSEEALWDKIILRKRGGFCYELNGMFAWLLKRIGFEVNYLNGRVYNAKGKRGREFDHLALQVRCPNKEQNWLVDVGFGDSFFEPLRFGDDNEQAQGLHAFCLYPVDDGIDLWKRDYNGQWSRQYLFDLQPRSFPLDYESTCNYHQTSPQSSFTRGRIVTIATPDGRITMGSNNLTITTNGKRVKRELRGEAEFQELLKFFFGIEL